MELFITVLIILLISGIVAGFLAGLFGIGGGVVMVPVMFFLLAELGYEDNAMTMAVATSAAVILPTAIAGTIRNYRELEFSWWPVLLLGTGGIIGTICGSTLSVLIPTEIHIIAFSGFLFLLACWMAFYQCKYLSRYRCKGSYLVFIIFGIGVGFAAGLFGIGGGVILTPVLVSLFGKTIHQSIGISLAAMVIIATGTVLSYISLGWDLPETIPFSIGYVNFLFAGVLACTSVPAVHLGIKTGKRVSEKNLHYLFIGLLIILAIRMLFTL